MAHDNSMRDWTLANRGHTISRKRMIRWVKIGAPGEIARAGALVPR
jgi:hypothetical protein